MRLASTTTLPTARSSRVPSAAPAAPARKALGPLNANKQRDVSVQRPDKRRDAPAALSAGGGTLRKPPTTRPKASAPEFADPAPAVTSTTNVPVPITSNSAAATITAGNVAAKGPNKVVVARKVSPVLAQKVSHAVTEEAIIELQAELFEAEVQVLIERSAKEEAEAAVLIERSAKEEAEAAVAIERSAKEEAEAAVLTLQATVEQQAARLEETATQLKDATAAATAAASASGEAMMTPPDSHAGPAAQPPVINDGTPKAASLPLRRPPGVEEPRCDAATPPDSAHLRRQRIAEGLLTDISSIRAITPDATNTKPSKIPSPRYWTTPRGRCGGGGGVSSPLSMTAQRLPTVMVSTPVVGALAKAGFTPASAHSATPQRIRVANELTNETLDVSPRRLCHALVAMDREKERKMKQRIAELEEALQATCPCDDV